LDNLAKFGEGKNLEKKGRSEKILVLEKK